MKRKGGDQTKKQNLVARGRAVPPRARPRISADIHIRARPRRWVVAVRVADIELALHLRGVRSFPRCPRIKYQYFPAKLPKRGSVIFGSPLMGESGLQEHDDRWPAGPRPPRRARPAWPAAPAEPVRFGDFSSTLIAIP
jgi:hypothetical protein